MNMAIARMRSARGDIRQADFWQRCWAHPAASPHWKVTAPIKMFQRIRAVCDMCGAPHDLAYFARPEVHAQYANVAENLRLYLGGQ